MVCLFMHIRQNFLNSVRRIAIRKGGKKRTRTIHESKIVKKTDIFIAASDFAFGFLLVLFSPRNIGMRHN